MATSNRYDPPAESPGDQAHKMVRGTLGAIPVFGSYSVELWQTLFLSPLQKRQVEWMDNVAAGLEALEARHEGLIEELKGNEQFIDTVLQASQAVMRTSKDEKREALRNAVLNAALPKRPDDSLLTMFIGMVDEFSVLHLRLLKFLDDPLKCLQAQGQPKPEGNPHKTLWPFVKRSLPDLQDSDAICEQVCQDLHRRSLLIARSLHEDIGKYPFYPSRARDRQPGYAYSDPLPPAYLTIAAGSPTAFRNWTTEIGVQFLTFISEPAS